MRDSEGLTPAAVELILALVRERHGADFASYRRPTIERRIRTAMIAAGAADGAAFLVRLRRDPGESSRLLERLTLKVSRFWRDAGAVAALQGALAARLRRDPRPLRAWSAGCARGEEAYTLAILLEELAVPPGPGPDVLGTDLDAAAVAAAARAAYPDAALEELPPALRARHLDRVPDPQAPWRVRPRVRARVAFAAADLADPAPRGPFDLVACRNTLIYFQPELQRRALGELLVALAPGGLLWLGEAEWLPPAWLGAFEIVDRRARLFRRRGEGGGDAQA